MNPVAILKRVSFKNILKVIFIGIRRPLLIVPTIRATRECLKVADNEYGREHRKNGRANAFRHALWNYLIAKRCLRFSRDESKALYWTTIITDWHEYAFPNRDLARKMDLHNNEVGRIIFKENRSTPVNKVIAIVKQKTDESAQIDESSDLSQHKNQLVHITKQ